MLGVGLNQKPKPNTKLSFLLCDNVFLIIMGLKEIFNTMTDFFEHEHFEYAVIGAFALYGYGYVRATMDIDFVTLIGHQNKIKKFLESLGFETTHCSDAFSNHVHPVGTFRVDIMYVDGKTGVEIFSSLNKCDILNGSNVPVVAPEHLLAMKLFSASNNPDRTLKDLSDVRELIKNTNMDNKFIKKSFTKYGLIEYYDRIVNKS